MPWLTLSGSNYPCLERISMVPKMFEPLRFDCILIPSLQAVPFPLHMLIGRNHKQTETNQPSQPQIYSVFTTDSVSRGQKHRSDCMNADFVDRIWHQGPFLVLQINYELFCILDISSYIIWSSASPWENVPFDRCSHLRLQSACKNIASWTV